MPKRTMVKRVLLTRDTPALSPRKTGANSRLSACRISSASRLVLPMTLVGRTALSVEMSTKLLTPACKAACAVFKVPMTLFNNPSAILCSTMGTCL
ncbi:hypothetical protein D3C85_1719170 [compost metagenome]